MYQQIVMQSGGRFQVGPAWKTSLLQKQGYPWTKPAPSYFGTMSQTS